MNRTALAVLGLAVVSGCDAWLTKPSLYNSVAVVVSRRNGDPIPGVGVTLYTGQRPMGYGVTSADGRFSFTRVPQGLYGVAISVPDGYDAVENLIRGPSTIIVDRLEVADDTLSPVRFTLLKRGPGTLVVRVVQPDGTPFSAIPVEVYEPGRTNARATTDAGGAAVFPSIPFGVHGVLITRPYLYRDYLTPGDSLYAVRQDLVVEDGSRDSVVFVLTKCSGSFRVLALDQTGAPVPRANIVFYTAVQQLAVRPTGTDGRVTFTDAACALQHGVTISAPPGYSISEGRNSSFFDGLTFSNGSTADVTFRLRKL